MKLTIKGNNMTDDKISEVLKLLVEGLNLERARADIRHTTIMDAMSGMRGDAPENALHLYQEAAQQYARYPNPLYPVLALAEEAGEVSAMFAKNMRAGNPTSAIDKGKLLDELGDVLWNLAAIASDNDISLVEIATFNLEKLAERKKNNSLTAMDRLKTKKR